MPEDLPDDPALLKQMLLEAQDAKVTLPLKNVSLARCLNSRKDTT
ncbi:hypothetical protein BV349_05563 [Pseudomonas syringae pv. actinidiae]|nr:hypothetical protein BV349_05563 [Pseudomonas syringae pv. actinidiae]OSN64106.1 hypothetical protein BV351_05611 [Pseudomonas syringae pv. actinidiae]